MTLRLAFLALLLAACGGGGDTTDAGTTPDSGTTDDAGTTPDAGSTITPACTLPAVVPCTDNSILDLDLETAINPGVIENAADGSGFMSHIDATAGGFMPSMSYVYARFTPTGLERVEVGDEDALMSMNWDIAFRRFVIRLNSGPSGPSCVSAARTAAMTDYDSLAAPPAGLMYHQEEYYSAPPMCTEVTDMGLGGPGTVLLSFWRYPGCVAMTGNVYVLALADGRHVKMTVTAFYEPSFQATCDSTGSVAMSGNGSGNMRIRWAYIDP